jgi:hypothetical protein
MKRGGATTIDDPHFSEIVYHHGRVVESPEFENLGKLRDFRQTFRVSADTGRERSGSTSTKEKISPSKVDDRGTAVVPNFHGLQCRDPRTASARGARFRGGWRLLVFGEHFCDFWKKFRDFHGLCCLWEQFRPEMTKSCKNVPKICLQKPVANLLGLRGPSSAESGSPGAVRESFGVVTQNH